MRLKLITAFVCLCETISAAHGQSYRAPVGNCDAAVMSLESARLASAELHGAPQQAGSGACTLFNARQAAAQRLAQRADALLAACPGMDDAMAQGVRMAALAKTEVADATASRLASTSCVVSNAASR